MKNKISDLIKQYQSDINDANSTITHLDLKKNELLLNSNPFAFDDCSQNIREHEVKKKILQKAKLDLESLLDHL